MAGLAFPKIFGVSVKGSSHTAAGTDCQDAHACKDLPSGHVIIAVADGLGSASKSRDGSRLVVDTAVAEYAALVAASPSVEFKEAAKKTILRCLEKVGEKAKELNCQPGELASTFILVVSDKRGVWTAHVGDGAVVVRTDKELIAVSEPAESEYANEVTPLTSAKLEVDVRFSGPTPGVREIAAFTDGLQRAAFSTNGGVTAPHLKFFNPIFGFGQKLDVLKEGEAELKELLESKNICDNSDDDKTLVIAALGPRKDGAAVAAKPLARKAGPPAAKTPSGPSATGAPPSKTGLAPGAGSGRPSAIIPVVDVLIPAGNFLMGSPASVKHPDEFPQHEVFVDPFSIDKYPVTVAEYARFAKEKGRVMPAQPSWSTDRHPVVNVTWMEAKEYCDWAGKRLPTEAEWEKAARAGAATAWHFGDDERELGEYGWFKENSGGKAHPVGEKKANRAGLYDMAGNVFEWVQDGYHESYDGAPCDGSAWKSPQATHAVLRGGAWNSDANKCRAAYRQAYEPNLRGDHIGFRCAASFSPRSAQYGQKQGHVPHRQPDPGSSDEGQDASDEENSLLNSIKDPVNLGFIFLAVIILAFAYVFIWPRLEVLYTRALGPRGAESAPEFSPAPRVEGGGQSGGEPEGSAWPKNANLPSDAGLSSGETPLRQEPAPNRQKSSTEGQGGSKGLKDASEKDSTPETEKVKQAKGGLDIEWIEVLGGKFQMGSVGAEALPNEGPVHEETVNAFQLSRAEVTVAQFKACVDDKDDKKRCVKPSCLWSPERRPKHPVVCVTSAQAEQFCRWIGGRLPTEAEWEFAAGGEGKNLKYPWGNEDPNCARAVFNNGGRPGCGGNGAAPVCSKEKNKSKFCDLAGNVGEWTGDVFSRYEGAATQPQGGRVFSTPKLNFDPIVRITSSNDGGAGPALSVRGGSWKDLPTDIRTTRRKEIKNKSDDLGFRCAKDRQP